MNKYYKQEYLHKENFFNLLKKYEDINYLESNDTFEGVIQPKDSLNLNQGLPPKYSDYLQKVKENNPYFKIYAWTRGEIHDIQAIMEAWTRIIEFEQEYQKRKYRLYKIETRKQNEKFSLNIMSTTNPNSSMIMGGDTSAQVDPIEIECMEEMLKISIYFLAEEIIPSFES